MVFLPPFNIYKISLFSINESGDFMSNIRPFKGFRPTCDKAHLVAALPYDVLSSSEACTEAFDNPYSFLHVDKAEIDLDPSISPYDDSVYLKAAENLQKMISDGTYIQDEKPVFYLYALTMNGRTQTGLVCCCDVDEYLNGTIKKHEFTLKAKEIDRMKHVDVCNANTGPIFLMYRAKDEISSLIASCKENNPPVYVFTSDDNITHTVWVIDNEETLEQIRRLFSLVPSLYIADGHHRNASAVNVALKRREESAKTDPNAEYNFYLSVLFPDNELKIFDYNRVVKDLNNLSEEKFFNMVRENFHISPVLGSPRPTSIHTFGMYINGKWYRLTAKSEITDDNDPIMSLDVSILQKWLLEPVLGITDVRTNPRIDFVGGIRGLSELEKRVDSGEMKIAFALYPTTVSQVMAIADNNLTMPPKSTWFEPKLRSGIFIHKLTD